MKKILALLISIILVLGTVEAFAGEGVTVYAPDGRSAVILASDVPAWQAVGWYTYPVATVYAPDGRSCVISKSDVSAWQNVGWYTYPVAVVYSPNGGSAVISKDAVSSWVNVGWYTYPVATVYAPDGRTAVIAAGDVAAWQAVGWMDKNTRDKSVYLGEWRHAEYTEGNSVTVYDCQNGKISFLAFSANSRASKIAYALVENVQMVNDSGEFWYKDSWGNSGTGRISFYGNTLNISFDEQKTVGLWSVSIAEGYHYKTGAVDTSFDPEIYR